MSIGKRDELPDPTKLELQDIWHYGVAFNKNIFCNDPNGWTVIPKYKIDTVAALWQVVNWTIGRDGYRINGLFFNPAKKNGTEAWIFKENLLPEWGIIKKKYPKAKEVFVKFHGAFRERSIVLILWLIGGGSKIDDKLIGIRLKGAGDVRIWVTESSRELYDQIGKEIGQELGMERTDEFVTRATTDKFFLN